MAQITVAPGRCWQYSHYVGRQATAGMGFGQPIGVASTKDGVLFVASRGGARITKLTDDQEFISEFGRELPEPVSPSVWLTAIALDKDENVYVTDEWLNRVAVFDNDGQLLATWGESGEGEGQLDGPSGLAFDAEDNVWIVNSKNSRIQQFDKDGKYLSGFGRQGSG